MGIEPEYLEELQQSDTAVGLQRNADSSGLIGARIASGQVEGGVAGVAGVQGLKGFVSRPSSPSPLLGGGHHVPAAGSSKMGGAVVCSSLDSSQIGQSNELSASGDKSPAASTVVGNRPYGATLSSLASGALLRSTATPTPQAITVSHPQATAMSRLGGDGDNDDVLDMLLASSSVNTSTSAPSSRPNERPASAASSRLLPSLPLVPPSSVVQATTGLTLKAQIPSAGVGNDGELERLLGLPLALPPQV